MFRKPGICRLYNWSEQFKLGSFVKAITILILLRIVVMDFNNISTTKCGSLRNILKNVHIASIISLGLEIKLLLAEYTLLHIFALICTYVLQN